MLAILITVDARNMLYVWAMQADQSELLFKFQLTWQDPSDFAVTCDFFLREKAIIISSRMGENVVVTSKFQQFPVVA